MESVPVTEDDKNVSDDSKVTLSDFSEWFQQKKKKFWLEK